MFEFLFGKRRKSKRRKIKVHKIRRVRRTRFGESPRLAAPPRAKPIRYADMVPGGGRLAKGSSSQIPYEKTGMKMQQATDLPGVTTPSFNPASGTIVPIQPPSQALQESNQPPGGMFPGDVTTPSFNSAPAIFTGSFGKRARKRHKSKKLPAKIRNLCKKLKIKITKKVGKHRVSKSISVLKKQIARKMRGRKGGTRRKRSTGPRMSKEQVKHEIATIVAKVEEQGGSPVEKAEAAAAAVADLVEQTDVSPVEVVQLATQTAAMVAQEAGGSPEEVQEAVEQVRKNTEEVVSEDLDAFSDLSNLPSYNAGDDYSDLNLEGLAFGRRINFGRCQRCNRRSHFGVECKDLARTEEECTDYTLNGNYPCYLTKAGCRKRIDKQSRHSRYVVGQTKSKVVKKILREHTRDTGTQTMPIKNSLDDIDTYDSGPDLNDLDFGKRRSKRYRSRRSKLPKKIRKLCKKYRIKCTKKVHGTRVYKTLSVIKKQLSKKMKKK